MAGHCAWLREMLIAMVICTGGGSAPAAVVSELLVGPIGGHPRYLEIELQGHTGPLDLVILDAAPERERTVWQVISLDIAAGTDTAIIHEATWPLSPHGGALVHGVDSALLLTGAGPSARRAVLFDHATGWTTRAAKLSQWTGVLDVLTWRIGDAPATATFGQPLDLEPDDGVYRRASGHDGSVSYTTGAVDSGLYFTESPTQLDPGQINESGAPEPTTASLLIVGLGALLRRCR
jgi:hypothetical protein